MTPPLPPALDGFEEWSARPTPEMLKAVRETLGLSQRALAHLLGVDPSAVNRWESGARRIPPHLRLALAQLLSQHDRPPPA